MMISWLRFQNSVWNDDLLTEDGDGDHRVTEKYGFGFGAADEQCMRVCSAASVASGSVWPHELSPARLLCPQNSPGKNPGVGCHFLLQNNA